MRLTPALLFLTANEAATKRVGVFRSRDYGEHWEALDSALPVYPSTIFALEKPQSMIWVTYSDPNPDLFHPRS